jgi:hypothetical protein
MIVTSYAKAFDPLPDNLNNLFALRTLEQVTAAIERRGEQSPLTFSPYV